MTALDRYIWLEATAIWHEAPGAPPREVVVRFGNATLLFTDHRDRTLGHWALAGMQVLDTDARGFTIYAMSSDGAETLAIRDREMNDAIAEVAHGSITAQPREARPPRRMRLLPLLAIAAALAVVAAFGPEAIRAQAIRMVPAEQAEELGDQMLLALMDRGGGLCSQPAGRRALDRIAARVTGNGVPPRVQVLALGAALSAALPGGMVLLDSAAVQGAEAPGAIAGWMAVALDRDPVAALMAGIGPLEDLRYVLTGEVGYGALAAAATDALAPPTQAEATAALDRLSARGIDPNAFTEAMHRAGLDTPYRDPAGPREPLLADQDWVALKGICG